MKRDDRRSPLFPAANRMGIFLILLIYSGLIGGCQPSPLVPEATPEVAPAQIPEGMSPEGAATLASLQQVDDYPLYTMAYLVDYSIPGAASGIMPELPERVNWSCSLFAALGDSGEILFGRNFDWDFSPGLLLYTDPEDGYASVSMVDMYYLGFGYEEAFGLTDLPLESLAGLLAAPYLPFDGMNEAGLVVGMAAVPDTGMMPDPERETVDSLLIIRMVLDQAASIEEAVEIFRDHNINWGSGPALHYLVADASGRSALIEFSSGGMVILDNQGPWQGATNFLLSKAWADPATLCWRYGLISERLEGSGGTISPEEGMALLEGVAQENTQWSVIYRISAGEVWIAMGRGYSNTYQFNLWPGKLSLIN